MRRSTCAPRRVHRTNAAETGRLVSPGVLLVVGLATLVYLAVAVTPPARDYYFTAQLARTAARRLLKATESAEKMPAWLVDQVGSSEHLEVNEDDVTIERVPGEYAAVQVDVTLWITWPLVSKITARRMTIEAVAEP